MANTIQHKRSSTSGATPAASGLSHGELAINIADGKLYTKNNSNTVINLGVTSISGTYITPSSGNFFNYLAVNGVPVSVSGHSHESVPRAESLITTVFNETGSSISKMTAVYINGGHGDRPTIQKAIATGDATSAGTYGLTYETIGINQEGRVIVFGALSGVNTDQFNPTAPTGDVNGTVVYLSPTVSGGLTTTKPYAPNHIVALGVITRTHQNEGVIEIRVQNGFELEELHNVAISGVTNGQFLQYNSASGLWLASNSGNFSSLTINNTNIATGTGIANHIAYWNSTSGITADSGQLVWDSTNNRLGIGTNNPGVSLDVRGSVIFNEDGANNDFRVEGDTATNLFFVDASTDNVGINTNAPSTRLQVNGTFSCGSNSDPSVGGQGLLVDPANDTIAFYDSGPNNIITINANGLTLNDIASNPFFYIDRDNSKVGIGTNSPSGQLHVIGTGIFSGGLQISNQTTSTIASFDTNKNIVSLSTSTYPSLTEFSYVKGVTSAIQTQLNSKQATLTNPVTGTGVANHIAYWDSASGIVADSGQLYWDATNNRLGIGLNNPTSPLQVSGEIKSNFLYIDGNDLTGGGQSPSINLRGYAWFGKKDGSVGIGISHNIAGTFGSTAEFYTFTGMNAAVTAYRPMCFTAGFFAQVYMHTNGNVGINNGNPAYKLDVNGTANVATSLRINAQTASTIASFDSNKNIVSLSTSTYPSLTELSYIKGVTSAIQTQLNAKQATLTNPVTGTGTDLYLPKFNSASGLTNSIIYDNGTNIGIGTLSPSTKLQVNGFISQSANHITVGLTSDQTIPSGVDTVVQMTDKDDPNNWWNGTTYRFLPTVSGYYYISAQVNWKSDEGTGQINSQLRRNGTTFCLTMTPQINSTGNTITHSLNGIVNMNGSTDYVDLTAYTSSTDGSQLISGTADQAWTKLEAFKIS